MLRALIDRCQACGGDVSGHAWTLLATARADTAEARALRLAFAERDWPTAMNLQTGSMGADHFEIVAVKCDPTSRLVVVEVLSPFEPLLDDAILSTAVLSPADSRALDSLVDELAWHRAE